jgi:four helix bundle protein
VLQSRSNIASMGDYRQLTVWKRAHSLTMEVYRITRTFPAHERYGLAAQLRRAATSVVSNIAEGSARYSNRDEARFYRVARGSLAELGCQLLLSRDIDYLDAKYWTHLNKECDEVGKMLNGLIRSARSRHRPI